MAVGVARVMFESKWDPDGLTTLTTQDTLSQPWDSTMFILTQSIREFDLFIGPFTPLRAFPTSPVGTLSLIPLLSWH